MLLLSPGIQAASQVDGLNDNPFVRLAFALDPFAIGRKQPLNSQSAERLLWRKADTQELEI